MNNFTSKGETLKSENDRINATKILRMKRKILIGFIMIVATLIVSKVVTVLVGGFVLLSGIFAGV